MTTDTPRLIRMSTRLAKALFLFGCGLMFIAGTAIEMAGLSGWTITPWLLVGVGLIGQVSAAMLVYTLSGGTD